MGGEEFLLILPGAGSNDASGIIDRIRNGFSPAKLTEDGVELPYTFSAGIAEARPTDDPSTVLRRADRALYAAKAQGRNCTRIGVAPE
jgi:diguanylate cyclase (GGDEF)-like protein